MDRLDALVGYRPAKRLSVVLYGNRQFHEVTLAHGGVEGLFDGKIRLPVEVATSDGSVLERLKSRAEGIRTADSGATAGE